MPQDPHVRPPGVGTSNDPEVVKDPTIAALLAPELDVVLWPAARDGSVSAWWGHVPFAHWLVRASRPRTIVELGTHTGVSYSAFCEAVLREGLETKCFAVDTWRGDEHAGQYGEQVFEEWCGFHQARYSAFSRLMRSTFDEALQHFQDASIDLLHIDGLHTYDAVKHDFESWLPKMSDRGVVLFHDTKVRERDFGVWRLWEELRQRYSGFEFDHGHGLGVLMVGSAPPQAITTLHELTPEDSEKIRERFSALGARWIATNTAIEMSQRARDLEHLLAGKWKEFLSTARGTSGLRNAADRRLPFGDLGTRTVPGHADTLGNILSDSAQAIDSQSNSISALQAEIDELEAGLVALALENAESQTRLATALAQHGQLRAQHSDQIMALQSKFLAAQAEQENRHAARLAKLNAMVTRLAHEETLARDALHELQQSTFWRATSRLRRGLAHMPRPLRMTLRRGAKAVWWALTPHRLPDRILFLRGHNHPGAAGGRLERAVSPSAQPRQRFLAFQPQALGTGADRTADRNGSYRLQEQPGGYTYVPPRKPDDLEQILASLPKRPRFSIVVPTYNTTTDLLTRLLACVQAQWYPDWQLILADDASPHEDTRRFLARIEDPRVEVLLLEQNSGISGATNAALEKATGDYIVFLDHDDELTENCLYELALCVDKEDPDYIYSDEDKIDEAGRFTQPFFKPAWSPDTLMSTMYTCHVSCVRRSLLEEVGPLRSEFDGSQDWDLVLRITERAKRIAHIPKVLYHWRMITGSASGTLTAKPYAIDASVRARTAALERRGFSGALEQVGPVFGYSRVRYAVTGNPLVSIIIPSRNNGAVLKRCLESLRVTSQWRNYEVMVLDNGSDDPETLEILSALAKQDAVRVIRHDAPFNYSELNNLGVRETRGEILLFLNDDTELLTPDGLERMIGYAQLPHIAAVGAKLLYPQTMHIQHSGVINLAPGPSHAFMHQPADKPCYFQRNLLEFNWIAVTGACLMIERAKYEAVGGFDEAFPVAYNDVDLCFRLLRQGLYHVVCPAVRLLHHESLSRGHDHETPERLARLDADRYRLFAAHPDLLMRDPFYSPNLHPNNVQFEVPV